ncbi:MAG: (Fe-S)-binding protein [Oscillospiraceae bacterium]|nr:(Fe-S)-binding protein [Oscillospiraceae bacterium]
MIISKKSKETIDSCRFCWMCRHTCPIGNATGQERNTSRARALSLSLVLRGSSELTPDIIDNVYECALCGACTKECVTGWDPVAFTKEVRLQIAMESKSPPYIEKMLDNMEKSGNIYGIMSFDKNLSREIEALPQKADILLFLGQDARYKAPKAAVNAIKLLNKADVKFTVLMDEPDSGYLLDTLVGAAEETRQAMKKAAKVLSEYKTVVAFDPADAKTFLREYKEWDIPQSADVVTFTSFIEELIGNGKLKPKNIHKTVTLQDAAHLARDLEETEPFRKVVGSCADVKEMLLNRRDTMWAGNLLMNEYIPDVMTKVASERWTNAIASGADALVTASPSEYAVLSKCKPESMELLTLEELVLLSLK